MSSENIDSVQNFETDKNDKLEELITSILNRQELIESEIKKLHAETKKLIKSFQKKIQKPKINQQNHLVVLQNLL